MQSEFVIILYSTITIALLHTLAGPDHYLPFIALAKTKQWNFSKTIFWTVLCGSGHVLSSVFIGLGGAVIGWNLNKIKYFENIRGGIAGWAFLIVGLLYCIWGLYRAQKNKMHKHFDVMDDDALYVYEHQHGKAVISNQRHKVTPWVMFIIFLLGPCEPMIPLLYLPAVQHSWYEMLLIILVYTATTLVTMITIVSLGFYGFSLFNKTEFLEKYMHAMGGLTLFICGIGMLFMGW